MASTARATMCGQVENQHGACGRVNARGRLAQGPAHNAALCSSLERGLSVVMWPASRRAGGPAGRRAVRRRGTGSGGAAGRVPPSRLILMTRPRGVGSQRAGSSERAGARGSEWLCSWQISCWSRSSRCTLSTTRPGSGSRNGTRTCPNSSRCQTRRRSRMHTDLLASARRKHWLSASLILFSLLTVSWRTQGMKSGVMDNVFDDLDTTPVVSRASVLLGCLRFSVSFLALLRWIHAT